MENHQSFGADLAVEFFAPSYYLSCRKVLRNFFRELVPAVDMKVLPRPMAMRIINFVDNFSPVTRWLFSPLTRWLTDPTFYCLSGCGSKLDGVTMILAIQTSRIDLHTWPEIPGAGLYKEGRAAPFGYARLEISTCAPAGITIGYVIDILEAHFGAKVFHVDLREWRGPTGEN